MHDERVGAVQAMSGILKSWIRSKVGQSLKTVAENPIRLVQSQRVQVMRVGEDFRSQKAKMAVSYI